MGAAGADLRSMSTRRWRASVVRRARVAAKAVPSCPQAASMPSRLTHQRALSFLSRAHWSSADALRLPTLLLLTSSSSAAG